VSPRDALCSLLDSIVERVAFDSHDGRSGATLARAVLDDGRRVVVKTATVRSDLTAVLGGDPGGRERRLWERGLLDELPAPVGHAVLAAGWVDGRLVTVMRDLRDAVLTWGRRITSDELGRIFGALATLHRHFANAAPDGLCGLRTRVSLFAPGRVASVGCHHPLAHAVPAGWDRFAELVPADIADAVLSALAEPDDLVRLLGSGGTTLCHGDAWLVNIALTDDEVVLLDWNLATRGPASLDLVDFAIGCAANVDLPIDLVLAAARDACRDLVDDIVWNASVFWALCELGWNKALDAVSHPDPAEQARARRELDWWVDQAERALRSM